MMSALGLPSTGAFVGMAGLAATVAALSIGLKGGLTASIALGIGATVLVLTSGLWWAAATVMAIIALWFGLSARRGWQSAFLFVPIGLGFVASDAAKSVEQFEYSALVLGASFLVWGAVTAGLTHVVFRKPIMPKSTGESKTVVAGYTGMLTVVTFITQGLAIALDLGHVGGWLVMTPFIVIQPHLHDGWQKALRRAGGTVLGFLIVMAVAAITTAPVILYIISTAAFTAAMYAKIRNWNYFIFAMFLTPAIVILEGISSSLAQLAEYRLEATLAGVGLSLIAMVVLGLIARRLPQPEGSETT
jgi:hypothetical protein